MPDAAAVLGSARALLLDFDGPITPLLPAPANMHAADAGQAALAVHEIGVARAVGVRSIGYAKNPRRGAELREAGADAITDSISDLVTL